ncbi:putative lysR-type transcriptional regulator [[Actinomadura] parvosata subsp. kistnae]|uniref:LysR family transcriptional regulator n=1 Tax=[Actinomadura] parvosata subsp. kistnae TaxID=1909395 RepID=A0A1V0A3F7_9ACTN|nr:LysR family transcriptional regulator [Nonomuraea sp. ATCC 55076]AQZ64746.1 LysR family transcriptional regulator [Nonomuraea sp. ATCC 55076]SPL98506.1 putative lysR-type transcriptional regulator [Actinomadura parvosata subsp. kistnae]
METRELAYFAAVAEELHFGRAAARLGMAQPPLSRAIQKLERRLGVRLFERSSRGVSLTPAGEVLAREAAKVLDAVAAATARTRRAGLAEPRLVVALKPGGDGGLLPDVLAAYRERPGAIGVELALCGVAERARLVRDGTADVAFLHSPYEDLTGFDSEPLRVEGSVAIMTAAHPLAGRTHLHLADLDADPTPRWPGAHPEVSDPAMLMQLVALGRLVVVAPESVRDQMRRDLACVPVLDAPPTTVVLAWPEGTRSRALAEFVHTATEVATRHSVPAQNTAPHASPALPASPAPGS